MSFVLKVLYVFWKLCFASLTKCKRDIQTERRREKDGDRKEKELETELENKRRTRKDFFGEISTARFVR